MVTRFIVIKYYSDGSGSPTVSLAMNAAELLDTAFDDQTGDRVTVLEAAGEIAFIYSDDPSIAEALR